MKVLCIDSWIAERIKVKPITNAELDMFQKDMNLKMLSFEKKCITCGTIIMFRDNTLGVYVDGDIAKQIRTFFRFITTDKFFLAIRGLTNFQDTFLNMDSLWNDLLSRNRDESDIIRIYENPLGEQELNALMNDDFYPVLEDFAKSRKYIERN